LELKESLKSRKENLTPEEKSLEMLKTELEAFSEAKTKEEDEMATTSLGLLKNRGGSHQHLNTERVTGSKKPEVILSEKNSRRSGESALSRQKTHSHSESHSETKSVKSHSAAKSALESELDLDSPWIHNGGNRDPRSAKEKSRHDQLVLDSISKKGSTDTLSIEKKINKLPSDESLKRITDTKSYDSSSDDITEATKRLSDALDSLDATTGTLTPSSDDKKDTNAVDLSNSGKIKTQTVMKEVKRDAVKEVKSEEPKKQDSSLHSILQAVKQKEDKVDKEESLKASQTLAQKSEKVTEKKEESKTKKKGDIDDSSISSLDIAGDLDKTKEILQGQKASLEAQYNREHDKLMAQLDDEKRVLEAKADSTLDTDSSSSSGSLSLKDMMGTHDHISESSLNTDLKKTTSLADLTSDESLIKKTDQEDQSTKQLLKKLAEEHSIARKQQEQKVADLKKQKLSETLGIPTESSTDEKPKSLIDQTEQAVSHGSSKLASSELESLQSQLSEHSIDQREEVLERRLSKILDGKDTSDSSTESSFSDSEKALADSIQESKDEAILSERLNNLDKTTGESKQEELNYDAPLANHYGPASSNRDSSSSHTAISHPEAKKSKTEQHIDRLLSGDLESHEEDDLSSALGVSKSHKELHQRAQELTKERRSVYEAAGGRVHSKQIADDLDRVTDGTSSLDSDHNYSLEPSSNLNVNLYEGEMPRIKLTGDSDDITNHLADPKQGQVPIQASVKSGDSPLSMELRSDKKTDQFSISNNKENDDIFKAPTAVPKFSSGEDDDLKRSLDVLSAHLDRVKAGSGKSSDVAREATKKAAELRQALRSMEELTKKEDASVNSPKVDRVRGLTENVMTTKLKSSSGLANGSDQLLRVKVVEDQRIDENRLREARRIVKEAEELEARNKQVKTKTGRC